jgi:transcriptional regulator with XRE-family HTH domain
MEICSVKNNIGERIRKIRERKGYSQANVAEDLAITPGAYAKIERGETDAPTSRLLQIAKSLEVEVAEFFSDARVPAIKENKINYGYASKEDVESLAKLVHSLAKEIEKLRQELPKPATRSKKIKK